MMKKKTMEINFNKRPLSQGLYDPNFEHDACGIGFVANIKGNKEHSIISDGFAVNLESVFARKLFCFFSSSI